MSDTLIEKTDTNIRELVYPKYSLKKAYNYYYGKRDKEQFKYLQEEFGLGSPTEITFTPLIKKHIDALIGEYLGTPILPKVTCKDSSTLSSMAIEKETKISKNITKFLMQGIKNAIVAVKNNQNIQDTQIKPQLDNIKETTDKKFISIYEESAQNVIEYLMQNRNIDFKNKLKSLFLDLLVGGTPYYRVKASPSNTNVVFEVLDPLNTFVDLNPDSPYVKDGYRAVVRKWYTAPQIISIYGKDLSKEDKETLRKEFDEFSKDYGTYVVRSAEPVRSSSIEDHDTESEPGVPSNRFVAYDSRLIPVYEVEWIDIDDKEVMQRYKTVRIGDSSSIYITKGKDDSVVRSKDNPKQCTLSINGVCYRNRDNTPYSLVEACQTLQDKYDLLIFYRDNLIANSGTIGDWIDMTLIPEELGATFPERLQKWISYKKAGIALLNSSQEGRMSMGQAPLNTIFNGYDDSIKAEAIQAIQVAIDSIEQTVSSITGVFRERLNGIQQRDAVTNVQASMNNSYTITKQYYHQMDLVTMEILLDMLNTAKIVYKKGITGNIILGDKKQKIFTALPEDFTLTDYDIHITTSSDVIREMEQIRQLIPQLIQNQAIDPLVAVEALTARSLSELKELVSGAIVKQKKENDQLQQLSQQNEQLVQQNEQLKQELNQCQSKLNQLNEAKMQMDMKVAEQKAELDKFTAETDRTYKQGLLKVQENRTKLEFEEKYDGNPMNDKIKMV